MFPSLVNLTFTKLTDLCIIYEKNQNDPILDLIPYFNRTAAEEKNDLDVNNWLFNVWSFIQSSPLLKEEGYKRLKSGIFKSRFAFQLYTFKPEFKLVGFAYKRNVYLQMTSEEFEKSVLENPNLKYHLENNVTEIRFPDIEDIPSIWIPNVDKLLNLNSLLTHLKSLKTFGFKSSCKITSEDTMQILSKCSDLTIFDSRCSSAFFFKYILGIDGKDSETGKEKSICDLIPEGVKITTQDFRLIVEQAKPRWPKLIYLPDLADRHFNSCCTDCWYYFEAIKLVYLFGILPNLNLIGKTTISYMLALRKPSEIIRNCPSLYQGHFFSIYNKNLNLHSTGQLAKSFCLKFYNDFLKIEDGRDATLDDLKMIYDSKQYEIEVNVDDMRYFEKNRVLIEDQYPFIYAIVKTVNYHTRYNNNTPFFHHFKYFKMIYMTVHHDVIMERPCDATIKYLVVDVFTSRVIAIEDILWLFPKAQNIIIRMDTGTYMDIAINNSLKPSMLQSIICKLPNGPDSKLYIEPMCRWSSLLLPTVKLYYYRVNSLEKEHFYRLECHGWEHKYINVLDEQTLRWVSGLY